jgi:hypothetical protein
MKKVIFTETQIKNVLKSYINEIEKYTPSIDSPEDEEELENEWGVESDDPRKLKDPFSSLKSDDFYDQKLADYKTKQKQNAIRSSVNKGPSANFKDYDSKMSSDISYLGDWKKTDNPKSTYFDKFNGEISTKDDYTPARSNPINTPPKIKTVKNIEKNVKPKKEDKQTRYANAKSSLKKGFELVFGKIISNNQEKNWSTILAGVRNINTNLNRSVEIINTLHDPSENINKLNGIYQDILSMKEINDRKKEYKDFLYNIFDITKSNLKLFIMAYKNEGPDSENVMNLYFDLLEYIKLLDKTESKYNMIKHR